MPLLWVLRDVLEHDRHQVRLWHRRLRRLHGACRRPGGALLRHAGRQRRRQADPDHRGPGHAGEPHPLQAAWIAEQVPQCGYCQSGMLMAAAALLEQKPKPTDADIDEAMTQHLPLRHLPARPGGHQARRPGLKA